MRGTGSLPSVHAQRAAALLSYYTASPFPNLGPLQHEHFKQNVSSSCLETSPRRHVRPGGSGETGKEGGLVQWQWRWGRGGASEEGGRPSEGKGARRERRKGGRCRGAQNIPRRGRRRRSRSASWFPRGSSGSPSIQPVCPPGLVEKERDQRGEEMLRAAAGRCRWKQNGPGSSAASHKGPGGAAVQDWLPLVAESKHTDTHTETHKTPSSLLAFLSALKSIHVNAF